jgi:heptosyltransferase-2
MGLPTFQAVEERFERVTYLAGGAIPQVLWMPDRERRVVTSERCKTPSAVRREAAWMKSENFDAVLLVNHSFRSAITVKMAGIPVRVGHRTELRSMFLTHAVAYDETEFEAVSTSHLAAAIGISVPDQITTMPISDDERVRGNHFRDGATIGIQPGARFGAKQVPISVTIEIANALTRDGHRICLLGGKEEEGFAEELIAGMTDRPVNLVGKTGIRDSLGTLANLNLMIGSDTGLMHMAAAVGCPSITVFGPTPRAKWGHQYRPHQALQAEGGKMENTSAEAVLEAARRQLRG